MSSSVLVSLFKSNLSLGETSLRGDEEFMSTARNQTVHFAYTGHETGDFLHVIIVDGVASLSLDRSKADALFILSAHVENWDSFFAETPKAPFQSYWGILRKFGHQSGNEPQGDIAGFTKHARLWRQVLDHLRNVIYGTQPVSSGIPLDDTGDDDALVGRYVWLELIGWGKCKVFYEKSGTGSQSLLLCHTAGSDSRQYHTVMNNAMLRMKCTIVAFDLPGHGRSSLGANQLPDGHHNEEARYVDTIGQIIKKLGLLRTIVCGASMGGHICLAVAIRAAELGVSGVIPCEAAEYLPLHQPKYELPGDFEEAIINPERVSGLIGPKSPSYYRRNIWWGYSSQGIRIFQGDLNFYFRGWDARGRLESINTKVCPVYMLTGEYDYSCTPEVSAAAAKKISGAVFEEMYGLGHFPATEDPEKFLPYLFRGIAHIQSAHESFASRN